MSTKTVVALTLTIAVAVATSSVLYVTLFMTTPTSDLDAVSSSEPRHDLRTIEARPDMLASPTDELRIPQAMPSSKVPSVVPTSDQGGRPVAPLFQTDFTSVYDTQSIEDLEDAYEILKKKIEEIQTPAIQQRIDSGEYDILGYGNELIGAGGDRYKLDAHQFVPLEGSGKKEIRRIELPEDQYMEAYQMLYEAIWLVDELSHRKSVARSQSQSILDDD